MLVLGESRSLKHSDRVHRRYYEAHSEIFDQALKVPIIVSPDVGSEAECAVILCLCLLSRYGFRLVTSYWSRGNQ